MMLAVGCSGGDDSPTGTVSGVVTAELCAETDPAAPACEPQPVVGAPIEARHATDPAAEPRRTITDSAGEYRIDLDPGAWIVSGGPIPALDGTPAEVSVTVAAGDDLEVPLVYGSEVS